MGSFIITPKEAESLYLLIDELSLFRTDDPFLVYLVSMLHESVRI
jgi:hypothetical protein